MVLPPMCNKRLVIKQTLHSIARNILVLLVGILVGFVLLVAVFALPVERMEENVMLSTPTFDGSWGSGEESYEQLLKGYQTAQLDNSTDALMMLTAIHRSDEPITKQVANVYAYAGRTSLAYITLNELAETDFQSTRSISHARYWLGYLVALKPLLMVMNYMDIRMLNMLLQGGLLLAIVLLMQKRGIGRYILPFALSLVCITPMIVPFSMQFSTVFYVFSSAMLLLLWKPELIQKIGLSTLFLLIGMMTSYIDFLTYPIAAFGMPFVLQMLLSDKEDGRTLWKSFISLGLWWVIGYFGMWAGKWVIAWIFSGEQYFWYNLFAKIDERSSMVAEKTVLTFMDVLKSVFMVFAKKPYLLLSGGVIIGYAVKLVKARTNRNPLSLSHSLLFVTLALLPFAWYLAASNHTYNHAFFTSRGLIVSVFSGLCLVTRLTETKTLR